MLIGRIAQHHRATADDHRNVADADLEAIEQVLDPGVAVQVDIRVRMAVAREELLDAQRPRAVRRSHEHHVPQAARDQLHSAQQEGAHQDFTQLAVGLHEREEIVAIDLDHLARLGGADAPEPATARQHADLAGELPRSKQGHRVLGRADRSDDLDPALGDHEEARRLLAGFDQHIALVNAADPTMRGHARDLGRRERGKHVVGARVGRQLEGGYDCGHLGRSSVGEMRRNGVSYHG